MNTLTHSPFAASWPCRHGALCAARKAATALADAFHAWRRRGALINELAGLDDRELAEIGLQRSDIPMLADGHPVPAIDRWLVHR